MNWISILFLAVGFLGLVAIGVVIQVVLSSQKEKLTMKSMFHGIITLIWALPLVAVLAYFGEKVAPKFEPAQPPATHESYVFSDDSDEFVVNESAPKPYGEDVPEWVKMRMKKYGEGFLAVVNSRELASQEDAENEAFEEAEKLIESYYAKTHGNMHFGHIELTKKEIQSAIEQNHVESRMSGTKINEFQVYRVHYQLNLTPELSESLVSRAKESVSRSRIWTIASIFAACTILLFGFSSYLRLDTQTEGRYRNRLKFAAVSFMAVGCLVIAEFFPLG